MQIYQLTPIGNSLATSTHPVGDVRSMMRWKIIYLIRRLHKASKEQVIQMTGLPSGEVSNALVTLENKGVIQDVTK